MIVNVHQFARWKQEGRPISVLTAWDYLSAQIVDAAGADFVLVGDSMAMPVMGHETTLPLTLDATCSGSCGERNWRSGREDGRWLSRYGGNHR